MQKNLAKRNNRTFKLLFKVWRNISPKLRKETYFALFIMIISAFSESISLAAFLPFLTLISDPSRINQIQFSKFFLNLLNINRPTEGIIFFAFLFSISLIISAILRIFNIWFTSRLAGRIGSSISSNAFKRTLYQDYSVHISRNSSEVLNPIIAQTTQTIVAINLFLQLCTSLLISVSIIFGLLIIETKIAIITFLFFGIIYILIAFNVKDRLQRNSRIFLEESNMQVKILQESIGSIRDIILNSIQLTYFENFQKVDQSMRTRQANNIFIASFPKYVIESLGIITIAWLAILIDKEENTNSVVASIGVLALGSQRLLPSLQSIYSSWGTIKGRTSSIQSILKLLEQPMPNFEYKNSLKPYKFKNSIKLENIEFSYNEEKKILNKINIEIKKGDSLGIKGASGVGKTTLIDIIMGLIEPTGGKISVDGKNLTNLKYLISWRKSISHVPQNIFLLDASFYENIAFGEDKEKIDYVRAEKAAKCVLLDDFINSRKYKYNTKIGERGIQISGGQRQRIAIARAIYKKSEILILDEATSALDYKTENQLMKNINNIGDNITMIIVAHRLSTLEKCNRIIDLNKE